MNYDFFTERVNEEWLEFDTNMIITDKYYAYKQKRQNTLSKDVQEVEQVIKCIYI